MFNNQPEGGYFKYRCATGPEDMKPEAESVA